MTKEDIELVIKIDKEQYEFISQSMTMYKVKDYYALMYDICEHIKNGTVLPKGEMQVVINIPKNEIPKKQDIIYVALHFMDGKIVECDYPFIELEQEESEEV